MEFKEKTKEALKQANKLLLIEMTGYDWESDERNRLWDLITKIEFLIYNDFKK